MFQREIYVPFIQTYLWYQFQAFAAVFRKRELICTNSKHDYEAKLTSLNYFPFNQTMSRPVCPCKMENNQQLCTCIIKPAKNSGLNGIRTQNLCDISECRSYHWSIKLNGSCLLLEFVIYAPCDKSLLLNPWWGEEKKNKALRKSHGALAVAEARTSGLVILVFSRQTGQFRVWASVYW